MFDKKVKAILFMFLILFCIAAVNAESVNDIPTVDIANVENMDDAIAIESEAPGSFTDLNGVINGEGNSSKDTIELNNDYKYAGSSESKFSKGITINRTLTIDGKGHIINGSYQARIFNVGSNASLTIKNIILTGGRVMYGEGGAIYNSGNLTLVNATFDRNTMSHKGGAIYNTGNLNISDSTFTSNRVIGTSMNVYGGAIDNRGSLILVNSTFDKNNATCTNNGDVKNTSQYQFTATYGGTINNEGDLTVIGCSFNDSTAIYGGAILNKGSMTMINSKFSNSTSFMGIVSDEGRTKSTIINSTFNNGWSRYGGAIYFESYLDIINSTFANNTALYNGGAIYGDGNINIANSTFSNNTARSGGAILSESNITIYNSVFDHNSAGEGGALIVSQYGDISESTFTDNNSTSEGGAIYAIGNVTVSKSEFSNNKAAYGGAIYFTHIMGTNKYVYGNLKVLDSTFDENYGDFGDDIYTTYNTTVSGNSYTKNSNANIYANKTIVNCTVVTVLGNMTKTVQPGSKFKVNATLYLDGAIVEGYDLIITDGEHNYTTKYLGNGIYETEDEIEVDFIYREYSVIINSDPDNPHYVVEKGAVSTRKDVKIEVELDPAVAGGNITGNITLVDENGEVANITGEVNVEIEGKNFTVNVTEGKGKLNIEDEFGPGNYTMDVTFPGNEQYNPAETAANLTIEDNGIILEVNDLTKYYGNDTKLIIMLTDSKGNPLVNQEIEIKINGVTYTRMTDSEGKVNMGINLIPGIYKTEVSYGDIVKNVNVTVLSTIEAEDLVKYFKNGTQYYAKFLNVDGTPLANTNVTFNIHGVFYNRTTDENGIAKLNINLNPGEYILTAFNPVNNESKSNLITVLSTIFGEDVFKFYRNGTQYYAYVLDEKGNPLANANVTFNIHGVFYNRTTDDKGIVKLNINLNPGKYILTAWNLWNGEATSNNITVYNVVLTEDLEMTTQARKPFNVTILGEQGKPLANANITFNIHGVFYHKTTDSNGQVNLDINLIAGKYIITTYYNEYAVSNTIVVK